VKPAIRIGVVGAGAVAQVAHLPLLSKLRGAQLVALCDDDGVKARVLAERFEIPDVFTDIEDLFEFDELDAVVICTPNHLHEPHVLSALASKVHVLCERPLALTHEASSGSSALRHGPIARCRWRTTIAFEPTCRR